MEAHSYSHAKKTYSLVLAALFILTVITVSASEMDFGAPSVNVVVAMAIASIKASLVALFFMHLLYDRRIYAIIFLTGVVMLGIFLLFVLLDVDSRETIRPSNLKSPATTYAPVSGHLPT